MEALFEKRTVVAYYVFIKFFLNDSQTPLRGKWKTPQSIPVKLFMKIWIKS